MIRSFPQMLANMNTADQNPKEAEQVVDARPADRYNGEAPEPRKIPSGHMPFSVILPSSALVRNGSLIPKDELQALLKQLNLDPARPIVSTCGSGVTACILLLALHEKLGIPFERLALYDGSWAEWGESESKGAVVVSKGPKMAVTGGWL